MLRPIGLCPAIICACFLLVHICVGQTAPPPVVVTPSQAAPPPGPVVTGDQFDPAFRPDLKPESKPVPKTELPEAPKVAAGSTAPSLPGGVKLQSGPAPTHDASAAYSTPSKPYVIGALDVIEVAVYGSPNLSGFKDVGSDGMISMPLIGEIRADGLTKEQLMTVIREKLGAAVFVDPPEVTIQVARVNSKKYFVLGGVNRPGEFPLLGSTTVLDAFAITGGFHDFAKTNKIYILRGGKPIPFNYKEVIKGKKMEQNIQIESGDHIVVPEN